MTAEEKRQDFEICEAIAVGKLNQIRHMDSLAANQAIILLVNELAPAYGANSQVSPVVLRECAKMVLRRFSGLGLDEIRNAYRLWASDELDLKGAEMFHGNFTVPQMGKVLSAYEKYRNELIAEMRRQEAKVQKAFETRQREAKRREYLEMFPQLVKKEKVKIESWKDCPIHWYDTAGELGMMDLKFDDDLWARAKEIALANIKMESAQEKNHFKKRNLVKMMDQPELEEYKVKRIYQKMHVFEHLIKKKQ